MARSAHAKHPCKLRKLPRCSRCKIEFILITVKYENIPKISYEWECPKCHKAVSKEQLREEQPTEWEIFLSDWCKTENAKNR